MALASAYLCPFSPIQTTAVNARKGNRINTVVLELRSTRSPLQMLAGLYAKGDDKPLCM